MEHRWRLSHIAEKLSCEEPRVPHSEGGSEVTNSALSPHLSRSRPAACRLLRRAHIHHARPLQPQGWALPGPQRSAKHNGRSASSRLQLPRARVRAERAGCTPSWRARPRAEGRGGCRAPDVLPVASSPGDSPFVMNGRMHGIKSTHLHRQRRLNFLAWFFPRQLRRKDVKKRTQQKEAVLQRQLQVANFHHAALPLTPVRTWCSTNLCLFPKRKYLRMASSGPEIKHTRTLLCAYVKKSCFFSTRSTITCKKNH